MATYVAISTINEQNLGWTIYAKGSDKGAVMAEAQDVLKLTPNQYGNVSMEDQTLRNNLRVVSKTTAKRLYGIDLDSVFAECAWYNFEG